MKAVLTLLVAIGVLSASATAQLPETIASEHEAIDVESDIKSKLITFFRLADSNKNGLVTWTEFRSYREKYSYKSSNDIVGSQHAMLAQDKETFVWLAGGNDHHQTNKGFFTWGDLRERFTSDM